MIPPAPRHVVPTYAAMTAGRRADQPVDVHAALAGLAQFASRLRTCPPAALAFLRHADGLLRGTEAAPGVARTWAETVLFAEVSVREAQKELARVEDEAAAPAPAPAASSFSGFGDRLRSVFGPGDEARQRGASRPRRPSSSSTGRARRRRSRRPSPGARRPSRPTPAAPSAGAASKTRSSPRTAPSRTKWRRRPARRRSGSAAWRR